ncbi:hypothetical protein SPACI_042070 [Sporomusa acidovorans DSM 3132]|uniref:Uncharacterized protein n=2 Tax=Sporomusa TaxID=2375 RepID=A0ABZ3J7R1_SPOA4|nr:hypothetical protein SPACI_29870 [Sporomusa acidovorans DSM 3132]SDD78091.1 hypothetical protein SAMN04488499_100429 [Sporomusa acidovorans]
MSQFFPAYAQIAAIVPYYDDAGDTTALVSADGSTTTVQSRIRTVIQRLAKSRAIDLAVLRTQTREITKRTNLEPLPLAPGLVLVPVKVRQPRVAGDATTGYINYHAVTAVAASTNKPYQTTVTLSGKATLPVLWTVATVNHQLALAHLVANTPPANQTASAAGVLREAFPGYAPELLTLAVKLIDVFNDILSIKQYQAANTTVQTTANRLPPL